MSVRIADPWHKQMRALKPVKLVTVQRGIVLSIYFQQAKCDTSCDGARGPMAETWLPGGSGRKWLLKYALGNLY